MYKALHQKKVAVGLSGGVDSSVAAALLLEQGYNVVGVHMRRFDVPQQGCSGSEDRQDALRVAKKLNIPFRVVDFRETYQRKIIDRFLLDFKNGLTPNPDIWCNEIMKFGLFLDYSLRELGVDYIATGHYARIERDDGSDRLTSVASGVGCRLLRGTDSSKDQSYFLYRLSQLQLAHSLFPLGDIYKGSVRKMAEDYGLPTAQKPDSVGVCFIGDINMKEYLKEHIGVEMGAVCDVEGNVIGSHDGVQLYTIGQRHGFEITEYQGDPLYIVKKDIANNILVVGRGKDSDVYEFEVVDLVGEEDILRESDKGLSVRVRHLGKIIPCEVSSMKDSLVCRLSTPDRGMASGQHAVFYLGDLVLGGGIIRRIV